MKRKLAILLILIPVLLLGTAIAHLLLIPFTAPGSFEAFRTQLDRRMPALMQEHHVPGVAIALVHPLISGSGSYIVGHDGSNRGWKTAFLALPHQGEGIVILTNSEGGRALHEQVQCMWVGWATKGAIPLCLARQLPHKAISAAGIWLAIACAMFIWPHMSWWYAAGHGAGAGRVHRPAPAPCPFYGARRPHL